MTDSNLAVPNVRSPGTPVCYPNDAYQPATHQRSNNISVIQDREYIELHACQRLQLSCRGIAARSTDRARR